MTIELELYKVKFDFLNTVIQNPNIAILQTISDLLTRLLYYVEII